MSGSDDETFKKDGEGAFEGDEKGLKSDPEAL